MIDLTIRRSKEVQVGSLRVGGASPLVLIAGPCVIEDETSTLRLAGTLEELALKLDIPLIFKASFDKANRTAGSSYRGPGLTRGLEILAKVRNELDLPVTTDVHLPEQVPEAAAVVDLLQVPAFLCRQTDLLEACGRSDLPVNLKKGQFLAPWDMAPAAEKVEKAGGRGILLTERGSSFGYRNLVVDFRGLSVMRETGWPVVFDATHSVQLPGAAGGKTGGQREFIPGLMRAAVAAGVDALFLEVHPEPDKAPSDGANVVTPVQLEALWMQAQALATCARAFQSAQ